MRISMLRSLLPEKNESNPYPYTLAITQKNALTHSQRSVPLSCGEVEAPEIVESRVGRSAAAEDVKRTTQIRRAMRISLWRMRWKGKATGRKGEGKRGEREEEGDGEGGGKKGRGKERGDGEWGEG